MTEMPDIWVSRGETNLLRISEYIVMQIVPDSPNNFVVSSTSIRNLD